MVTALCVLNQLESPFIRYEASEPERCSGKTEIVVVLQNMLSTFEHFVSDANTTHTRGLSSPWTLIGRYLC